MRKFIVRNFALNRTFNVFGRYITVLRAGPWTMAAMLILMFTLAIGPYWEISVWSYLALAVLLTFLFIGFFYFRIRSVKWHELDDDQKIQAGAAIKAGHSTMVLTDKEWEEWHKLKDKY